MAVKMLVNRPISKDILGNHEGSRRSVDFSNLTGPRQISFLMAHGLKLMGMLVGLAAGYFGIGGGFLIVPSLLHLGLNISNAIGTSLIPVSMFGVLHSGVFLYKSSQRSNFNTACYWGRWRGVLGN